MTTEPYDLGLGRGDLRTGDVLVVTHKIVSKAEGRLIDLRTVEPSTLAKGYATRYGKDPRQIEVVLRRAAASYAWTAASSSRRPTTVSSAPTRA